MFLPLLFIAKVILKNSIAELNKANDAWEKAKANLAKFNNFCLNANEKVSQVRQKLFELSSKLNLVEIAINRFLNEIDGIYAEHPSLDWIVVINSGLNNNTTHLFENNSNPAEAEAAKNLENIRDSLKEAEIEKKKIQGSLIEVNEDYLRACKEQRDIKSIRSKLKRTVYVAEANAIRANMKVWKAEAKINGCKANATK